MRNMIWMNYHPKQKHTDKIKPTYVGFKHKEYKWKPDIDYRENPHLYEIGRGQQGVLICQPYKSELHPLWRFKTPEEAKLSAVRIINKFFQYLEEGDFVGADIIRNIYIWDLLVVVDIGTIVVVRNGKKYLKRIYVTTLVYHLRKSYQWKVLPYDRTEERFYKSSEIFKAYWKWLEKM